MKYEQLFFILTKNKRNNNRGEKVEGVNVTWLSQIRTPPVQRDVYLSRKEYPFFNFKNYF